MTDEMAPPVILALTVGGSRDPLESAIQATNPDILLLIASAAGPGSVSSREEAEAFRTAFEGSRAGRQARVIEVPVDDPGRAFARIVADIDQFQARHRGCRFVADYTGGTKSMSAALLMAAFQRDLETQIITGRREDLARVASGTEAAYSIDTRLIGVEREFATGLRVASHGDYASAASLIGNLVRRLEREKLNPPKSLNRRLKHAHDWAECLTFWDRFEHKSAWKRLEHGLDMGEPWAETLETAGHAAILKDLSSGADAPRVTLCQDLLENARRRASQGRFDDSLARLYRFTEACIQTQLYRRYKLKSGELAGSDLPPHLIGKLTPRGYPPVYETALRQTVDVLRFKDPNDPVALAYLSAGDYGPAWLSRRNRSILAHGYSAIGADVVNDAFQWLDKTLIPAMGISPMPPFPREPTLP